MNDLREAVGNYIETIRGSANPHPHATHLTRLISAWKWVKAAYKASDPGKPEPEPTTDMRLAGLEVRLSTVEHAMRQFEQEEMRRRPFREPSS